MKTIYILLISITLSVINKRIYAADAHPFTTPSTTSLTSTVAGDPAKFVSLNGSIVKNKVILEWQVAGNETADQFEVERSSDGKNFSMAALVFGTDKPETDQYLFYEKANPKKVLYRIKLIGKDQKITYSSVIEISPETSAPKL
jgi:hypothetical protein